jgi:flavin reductase (DIM6/NTAB) family NADH-FMN oxidoreductase RutF
MKDTLANALSTGEFVVNIMSTWFVEAANHTCGNYDPETDEFQVSGLTPLPSVVVQPPRVAESAVHMECVVRHHWDVKNDKACAVSSTGEQCSCPRAAPNLRSSCARSNFSIHRYKI